MAKMQITWTTEDGELIERALVEVNIEGDVPGDAFTRNRRLNVEDANEIAIMQDSAASTIAARARIAERAS